jgi:predicted metal-dependent hydrolase
MTTFALVYGDERIPYEVQSDEKRTRKIAIHVYPDGSVSVDAPPDYDASDIRAAVQRRARWVSSHVAEARARFTHVRPREYVSGEQVLYLGRRYVLKVVRTSVSPGPVKLRAGRVEVESTSGNPDEVKGRLRGWYRAKARDFFARRLDELSHRLHWVGPTPPFRLLGMTRQWGSCSPSGEIILNPHLIKAPRECVEYVLVHELAHLSHHDHGPEFWRLVEKAIPEWRFHKRKLDGMAELFFSE